MRNLIPPKPSRTSLISSLFHSLQGTWLLDRKLESEDPSAPSGRCAGKATFTATQPSPVIDSDGKLRLADSELLYHEEGDFEMSMATATAATGQGNPLKFPFSRKYIWRLDLDRADDDADALTISVWFTKPGTNAIDYLFHRIDISSSPLSPDDDCIPGPDDHHEPILLHGTGGHLCVADFYSSSYSFSLSQPLPGAAVGHSSPVPVTLSSWTMLHEVRGPKKDQTIETKFTKA